MKKPLKIALYVLLALVLIVLAYVIYVFAAYYRVEDMQICRTDGGRAADRRHLSRFVGQRGLRRVQRRLQLLHGRRQGEPRPQQASR